MAAKTFSINYKLQLAEGHEKCFNILIDKDSLNLVKENKPDYPVWCELECYQCPHCPLIKEKSKYCPVAVNLADVVESLGDCLSFAEVGVEVQTQERTYATQTNVAMAVTSLIGIYMVSNECPHMSKLKPMVRFHLPFASPFETSYRAIAMYLTAQFLRAKKGLSTDWEMNDLSKTYQEVSTVNQTFAKRIQNIDINKASLNAISNLNCFSFNIQSTFSDELIDELQPFFQSYLS